MEIRKITSVDSELLANFFESNNRPEIVAYFHPFSLTSATAAELCAADGQDRYFLALLDGTPVGFLMLRGWDAGFAIPSLGILIDHRFQGRGLGRQLTEFALRECERLGCRSVRLSVYGSNKRAVALYSSLGFRSTDRTPAKVQSLEDENIVMIKDLPH